MPIIDRRTTRYPKADAYTGGQSKWAPAITASHDFLRLSAPTRRTYLRHPANEAAGVFILGESQPNADVPAIQPRARKVLRNLVEPHVAVIDLDEKLYGALKPHVQAAHCRDLAEAVSSVATAEELREIAVEYDADAANIENEEASRSLAAPQS